MCIHGAGIKQITMTTNTLTDEQIDAVSYAVRLNLIRMKQLKRRGHAHPNITERLMQSINEMEIPQMVLFEMEFKKQLEQYKQIDFV